ncbi:MAG: hypothetical protein U9Q03_05795 [Patescibacteria group bacterium]|nr:hypothetical protein [Patescibacteria group bacterium]
MMALSRPNQCARCKSIGTITLVQYGRSCGTGHSCHPCHLDGYSEFKCERCGHRIGAWSGRTLVGTIDDDHEGPYGDEHRTDCHLYMQPQPVVCPTCDGTERVVTLSEDGSQIDLCPDCHTFN